MPDYTLANALQLHHTPELPESVNITLTASKSESNRVLIMQALAGGGGPVSNLAAARDTQTMQACLQQNTESVNVLDAGTTMRFLTAYYAIQNRSRYIHGTDRMHERPIGILVDALRSIGADIAYAGREGYPPLQLNGMNGQQSNVVKIRGDVSSQYISALMMIAPALPGGLTLRLTGEIGSRPYINMTLNLMKHFGITVEGNEVNEYFFKHQDYRVGAYTIEADWSAASYWYSLVALGKAGSVALKGLKEESLQGDHVIAGIMKQLGVDTAYTSNGVLLTKGRTEEEITIDFTDCPDLAQTVAVVCAAKNVKGVFTGLKSLRIKETDRIAALQTELAKIGASLEEHERAGEWVLTPDFRVAEEVTFSTYDDHRMAMAFAPLATLMNIRIENPGVVRKSYPAFWEDWEKAGITILAD
jgi:3-phosphoshikimate 1-carboxyvinyltransferase